MTTVKSKNKNYFIDFTENHYTKKYKLNYVWTWTKHVHNVVLETVFEKPLILDCYTRLSRARNHCVHLWQSDNGNCIIDVRRENAIYTNGFRVVFRGSNLSPHNKVNDDCCAALMNRNCCRSKLNNLRVIFTKLSLIKIIPSHVYP